MEKNFFLKGDICWSTSPNTLKTVENGFLLCIDGKSGGVFESPQEAAAFMEAAKEVSHVTDFRNLPVIDYSGKLIIPGLTDLHIHAPQYALRALGMDLELLEWLNKNVFPEEAKFSNPDYARTVFSSFIEDIKKGPNTRFCIYSSIHVPSTLLLMEMMEESGLVSLVGKVNMDRNSADFLSESDSEAATRQWLELIYQNHARGQMENTAPILTPRFIPSCSDSLMGKLGEIQKEFDLPVQSHLSENLKEIEWVAELCPGSKNYADAYAQFDLLGGSVPTIMAHCVWSAGEEADLLKERGVYIAHCPQSNSNLSSGIAPVKQFLQMGIPVGLGSDIAAGAHTSIFRAMSDAIQVSKLRHEAITLEEAFYMGTAGGGSFFGLLSGGNKNNSRYGFGSSGSFEKGWDFDAIVLDDAVAPNIEAGRNIRDRLETAVYLSDDRHIVDKYVRGRQIKQA